METPIELTAQVLALLKLGRHTYLWQSRELGPWFAVAPTDVDAAALLVAAGLLRAQRQGVLGTVMYAITPAGHDTLLIYERTQGVCQ